MRNVRFHSGSAQDPGEGTGCSAPGSAQRCGGRLNLLLSYGGWRAESWVDSLPRLLEPMGVVSLRAGTGREANHVLQQNQIHIAVVDLGLPLEARPRPGADTSDPDAHEEGGPRLLEILRRLSQPPPTVVVKRSRTHRDDCREIGAALRAGAFAVVDRPRDASDLGVMLEVLRRCLTRFYHGRWPEM